MQPRLRRRRRQPRASKGILDPGGGSRTTAPSPVGLCEPRRRTARRDTALMPRSFSCQTRSPETLGRETYSSIVNDGRPRAGGRPSPSPAGTRRAYLVVLHDLSFIDARSGQAQTYAVAGPVRRGGIIVAGWLPLAGAVAPARLDDQPCGGRWRTCGRAVLRSRRRGATCSGVNLQIQRLLKALDRGQGAHRGGRGANGRRSRCTTFCATPCPGPR